MKIEKNGLENFLENAIWWTFKKSELKFFTVYVKNTNSWHTATKLT